MGANTARPRLIRLLPPLHSLPNSQAPKAPTHSFPKTAATHLVPPIRRETHSLGCRGMHYGSSGCSLPMPCIACSHVFPRRGGFLATIRHRHLPLLTSWITTATTGFSNMHLHSHHHNIRDLYTISCFKNARLMIAPSFSLPQPPPAQAIIVQPSRRVMEKREIQIQR